MSDIIFDCKKCGTCCRGLYVLENGIVTGLCLTEEEAKMFDPEFIVPYIAIGDKKPSSVIFYQLTLVDCPHLSEKNQCNIYEKRPLICKVFPMKPNLNQVILLPKCPQISKKGSVAGEMCPVIIDDDETEEARIELNRIFLSCQQELAEKSLRFWFFDLASKRWVTSN